jgi:hypothetical protein
MKRIAPRKKAARKGRARLSDDEKRRRGTFRPCRALDAQPSDPAAAADDKFLARWTKVLSPTAAREARNQLLSATLFPVHGRPSVVPANRKIVSRVYRSLRRVLQVRRTTTVGPDEVARVRVLEQACRWRLR